VTARNAQHSLVLGEARPTSFPSGCTSTEPPPSCSRPMPGRDVITRRAVRSTTRKAGATRSAVWHGKVRHCAMAARQALNMCESELLMLPWDGADMPQSSVGVRRGQSRISVVTTRAALRVAGAPPHIAAALRSRLRLIPDQEAER
jgi:hypothetical protein